MLICRDPGLPRRLANACTARIPLVSLKAEGRAVLSVIPASQWLYDTHRAYRARERGHCWHTAPTLEFGAPSASLRTVAPFAPAPAMGEVSVKTLFSKVWDNHVVAQQQDETLLYVDRCLIHEGSRHTFDTLRERGLQVAHPDQVFAFSDHYIPTDPAARAHGIASVADLEIRDMLELLQKNTAEYGIKRFGWGDDRQGILHVAGPELGLSQPGIVLVGADSHTSTHGAF